MAVTTFERRLPSGALEFLSTMPQWWQDVLNYRYVDLGGIERPLLIALRDGYLNVYAEGQSVLKIGFDTRHKNSIRVRGEIHRKYVLGDDAGDGYLSFDGSQIMDRHDFNFAHSYSVTESLTAWVAAARSHSGGEKRGVARIAESHSNVIDIEMALPSNEPQPGEAKAANRMDIVALERDGSIGSGMRLAFYEAKLFSNKELRANDLMPRVLHQLRGYHAYVSEPIRRTQVIDAYRRTCAVLGEIAKMQGRTPNEYLSAVNAGAPLDLDPVPRLIVFDYLGNSVGEGSSWQRHEKALHDSGHQLIMASSPGGIQLPT